MAPADYPQKLQVVVGSVRISHGSIQRMARPADQPCMSLSDPVRRPA